MAADDGAGAGAIDVNIAGDQLGFQRSMFADCGRKSRRSARNQCRSDADRFVEIAHFQHAQDRAENFFAGKDHLRLHAREDSRNEKAFSGVRALNARVASFFPGLDRASIRR